MNGSLLIKKIKCYEKVIKNYDLCGGSWFLWK
ncbi:hypothetical protein C8N28_0007 [Albibacterium bauzanense]|uniref:Uncharacterized protein n=1 Tax=Albibacterium bauzanense TaxID=653929 RepID=A0A4R1LZG4_9SPHI|nr:hypothetical protein C8N28_0007 [Albibacterium bauzanense]